MNSTITAIPTTYAGVNFRSRLEARYAAFFDIVKWKWEYEPLDLEGWIPDFRVTIPCGRSDCNGSHTLLVEVKPHYTIDDFRDTPEYALAKQGYGGGRLCDAVALFGIDPGVSFWVIGRPVGDDRCPESIDEWVNDWTGAWREAGNIVQWHRGDAADEDPSIAASIDATMERFTAARELGKSPGLSFGISGLDKWTGGMMPGQQTVVGSAAGVGKTIFMCQSILAALQAGAPVDAFLLKPTKDQITLHLLSLMANVPYKAVTWAACSSDQSNLLVEAKRRLAQMPLRLHDSANLMLDEVIEIASSGIRRRGTRLICLDCIQQLHIPSVERDEPMRLRLARASMAFAGLVKGTPCHSMLLSQLKCGAEAIPTMFDFRESSQIADEADTIVLLYRQYDARESYYNGDDMILVPKQRYAIPFNLGARFDGVSVSWTDAPRSRYQ